MENEKTQAEKQLIKDVKMLEDVPKGSKDGNSEGPFATMTWERWQEAQARVDQCFSRFVSAVQEHRTDQVLMLGLEMQEIATQMLLEAYAMSANLPLEPLPEK